jgi:hypothetical protein
MTPAQFRSMALTVTDRIPADAQIVRNAVGNLAVMVNGEYAGFIDLVTGEVIMFEDED